MRIPKIFRNALLAYALFDFLLGYGGFLPGLQAQGNYTSPFLTAGSGLTLNYSSGSIIQGGNVQAITGATLTMAASQGSCVEPAYSACNFVYWTSGTSLSTTTTLATAMAPGNVLVGFVTSSGAAILVITHANTNIPVPAGASAALTGQAIPGFKSFTGNKAVLTSDFTDANASGLQAITGLSLSPPNSFVGNMTFHCLLMYTQATPSASNQFGLAILTTAPTRADAGAIVATNATAFQQGFANNITSTTPTAAATFTTVPSTQLVAYMDGLIQFAGGGVQTFQAEVTNGTAANVIVIKAGSFCELE